MCEKVIFFLDFTFTISFTECLLSFVLGESIEDLLFLACSYFIQLQHVLLTRFLCKLDSFCLFNLSSYESVPMPLTIFSIPLYTRYVTLHHGRKHLYPS